MIGSMMIVSLSLIGPYVFSLLVSRFPLIVLLLTLC
jgi:hypothetical protein